MYAIILTEGDVTYCETYTFERQDLWDWLHQEVTFPPGESAVCIDMPTGFPPQLEDETEAEDEIRSFPACAFITIGSPENDLAQALVADGCEEVGIKSLALHFDDDADDVGDEEAVELYVESARKALAVLGVQSDHIYEGLLY